MKRHLHLDPFAGLAGDMFLGALIHLGASLDEIRSALAPLDIKPGYDLSVEPTMRHHISAANFTVRVHDKPAHDHVHPPKILKMIDQLQVADRARDRARRIVQHLAEAEAAVHNKPVEKVHFHEVGAVDSIVDMIGSAIALELLDIDTISCGPLPIGHGFVRCAHGTMPLPAPATALLLRGIPQQGVDRPVETVTPTGAALVKALVTRFSPMPAMNVQAIGYGAGDRDDPDLPNLLRVYLGELA